jgi:hypothetical protein
VNEDDHWIYLDGKKPERVERFLEALLELPPPTPEERELLDDEFFAKLEVVAAQEREDRRARQAESGQPEGGRAEGGQPEGGAASVAAVAPAPMPMLEGPPRAAWVAEYGATVRSPTPVARDEAPAVAAPSAQAPPAGVWGPAPLVPGPVLPASRPVSPGPPMELPAATHEPAAPPIRQVTTGHVPVPGPLAVKTTPSEDLQNAVRIAEAVLKARAMGTSAAGAPAAQASASAAPSLTLELYAALQVELAMGMEQGKGDDTLRRYGMSPQEWAAWDAYWRQRLAGLPEERMKFDAVYREYWDQWRRQGR